MKKIVMSVAGVLAATAFAPEASAIPAFARQTGMACSACHQTHFPVLSSFGRAFKAAGYTLMGAQGRIEGENLSIPDTLNGALLFKYRYQKFNGGTPTTGAGQTAATNENDGMVQMGDEVSLFFGGRIAETEHFTIGFLNENNLAAGNAANGALAGLRVPITTDLGAVKASIVPFTTDSLGVGYGFELASNGIMRANRWSEMRRETSAVQYMADRGPDGGAAAGTAVVLHNDLFFVNLTKWSSSFAPGAAGGAVASTSFGQNYIRAAATPTIGDYAIIAGVGKESGKSYSNLGAAQVESNMSFADLQVHGDIAGMESGIYAMYASAPKCANTAACAHNSKALDRSAFTLGGEFTVVPHTLILQASYRNAKNGAPSAADPTKSETDNALMFGGIYELTQNVELHAYYAKYSGSTKKPQSTDTNVGSQYLLMLESAW